MGTTTVFYNVHTEGIAELEDHQLHWKAHTTSVALEKICYQMLRKGKANPIFSITTVAMEDQQQPAKEKHKIPLSIFLHYF